MKAFFFSFVSCLFFVTLSAQAGQSGYILNGKVVITHKDGEPVAEKSEQAKRAPAAATKIQGTLFFDEDDLARCYWKGSNNEIFCIKK